MTVRQIRGFWGDIVCSPFFAFGVDCETPGAHETGLFEIMNKVKKRFISVCFCGK